MPASVKNPEESRLRKVAREYENEGYEVVLHPNSSSLPDFLADFGIDLVAKNGEENVVIEVKSPSTLRTSRDLPRLAEVIGRTPGWRLDLAVMKDTRRAEEEGNLLSRPEIADRLSQVLTLLNQGFSDAALLLGCSAAESALRRIAKEEKIKLSRKPDLGKNASIYLVKQLYTDGVLDKETYELFSKAIEVRTRIVHGYKTPQPQPEIIRKLTRKVEQLLCL